MGERHYSRNEKKKRNISNPQADFLSFFVTNLFSNTSENAWNNISWIKGKALSLQFYAVSLFTNSEIHQIINWANYVRIYTTIQVNRTVLCCFNKKAAAAVFPTLFVPPKLVSVFLMTVCNLKMRQLLPSSCTLLIINLISASFMTWLL